MDDFNDQFYVPGWDNDRQAIEMVLESIPHPYAEDTAAADIADDQIPKRYYPWQIHKIAAGTDALVYNQGQVGSCFLAGTKVRMADGSYKNIEDIKTRDMVLSAEGNPKRVLKTFLRKEEHGLISFKCEGHYGLEATKEHPILTKRGYVELANLTTDDYVAFPKYAPCKRELINTEDYMEWYVEVKREHKQVQYAGAENNFGRKSCFARVGPMPSVVKLDEDFGRIIGLFLAEGSTDNRKTVWTFNINEADTLAKDLVDSIVRVFDIEPTLSFKRTNNVCNVTLHGTNFAMLFKKLCGNGAGMKRLHQHLAEGPREFLKVVFESWLDGDGHVKFHETTGTSVSQELALNMFDIANMLGLSPRIRWCDPKLSHGVKSRRRSYHVEFANGDGKKPEQDGKVMWRKVKAISHRPYSGDVFNFEVEGDNSYVVEGIGVHNCVGMGATSAVETVQVNEIYRGEATEEFRPLVQEITYGGSRVEANGGRPAFRGDGSTGALAAKFLRGWGVVDRGIHGKYDLTKYSEQRCREYGSRGVPDDLEPTAKIHAISDVTQVRTWKDAVKLMAQGYGIFVCSNYGFGSKNSRGVCSPRGVWNHCMEVWGYDLTLEFDSEEIGCIRNSWGRQAHPGAAGPGNPPAGTFWARATAIDAMLRQGDSFAVAGIKGFERKKPLDLDYSQV